MAEADGEPSGSGRRDVFAIFAATCATVALVFAVTNFFVASEARDTAEQAKTAAQQALSAAEHATVPDTTPTTTTRPAGAAGRVAVALDEYTIALDPASPPTGAVTFDVTNQGKIAHEFVLFRTDLPADALPVNKKGDVNEQAPQLQSVADSGSDLKPGASRTLHATLTPGHYVAVCNLPGHYAAGMRVDVTVP
ncbi:MAG TPA: sulfocyanin-like copper-binding protein [Acidimicrobiia bacterium]|nr:sulfocyanin-like copper-binding protein [Acidimicrobiia bacterium]